MRHKEGILKAIKIGRNYPHLVFRPGLPLQPQKFQEGTSRAADFASIIITSCISQAFSAPIKALPHLLFHIRYKFISLFKKNNKQQQNQALFSGFLGSLHF